MSQASAPPGSSRPTNFPAAATCVWLLPLPLAFPTYIVAYVYVDLLDAIGPVQSALRALFGWRSAADYWFPERPLARRRCLRHGLRALPLRLSRRPRDVPDPERGPDRDGARARRDPWRLARDIALPLARPAIAAGACARAARSAQRHRRQRISRRADADDCRSSPPGSTDRACGGAAQIACVMLAVVAILIAIERYGRRRRGFTGHDRKPGTAPPRQADWRGRRLGDGRLPDPGRARLLHPVRLPAARGDRPRTADRVRSGAVAPQPEHRADRQPAPRRRRSRWASAPCSRCGCLRRRFAAVCVFLAGLGYAVPGTVLALGLLSPLVAIDEAINWLTGRLAGVTVGLVLAGSSAAIVIAYVVRFLAIATGFAQAGLARISTDLDDAARSSGARPGEVVRGDPSAAAAAGAVGRGLADLRRLPEGTAGDAAAAAAQRRDAVDLHLPVRHPRQFRGRRARRLLIVAVGIFPVIRMVRHADDALAAAATPNAHPAGLIRLIAVREPR